MSPDAYIHSEFLLDVGDGHQLFVYDWGNERAETPIICLHGGPGDRAKDKHRDIFDPQLHRVIFFDQRGCGRSLPYGLLENNTTDDLVGDITKIANHLKIKQFYLVGASWGSFLALVYAIHNPKRVAGVVVSAIFTGTKDELEWFSEGRFKPFYPEAWEAYLLKTPESHRGNPTAYHYNMLLHGTEKEQFNAAMALQQLEYSILNLDDRTRTIDPITFDPSGARIEGHYLSQGCFVPDSYILEHTNQLTMPLWIVQGRYDMSCPPYTAYLLHKKVPHSQLFMTIGGHRAEHETYNLLRAILVRD
jgi:proline iminopeptidase